MITALINTDPGQLEFYTVCPGLAPYFKIKVLFYQLTSEHVVMPLTKATQHYKL